MLHLHVLPLCKNHRVRCFGIIWAASVLLFDTSMTDHLCPPTALIQFFALQMFYNAHFTKLGFWTVVFLPVVLPWTDIYSNSELYVAVNLSKKAIQTKPVMAAQKPLILIIVVTLGYMFFTVLAGIDVVLSCLRSCNQQLFGIFIWSVRFPKFLNILLYPFSCNMLLTVTTCQKHWLVSLGSAVD